MLKPVMTSVTSTMIEALGADRQGLLVRFHNGRTYQYPGAGDRLAEALEVARTGESVGQWFNKHIKPLPYRRLPG